MVGCWPPRAPVLPVEVCSVRSSLKTAPKISLLSAVGGCCRVDRQDTGGAVAGSVSIPGLPSIEDGGGTSRRCGFG